MVRIIGFDISSATIGWGVMDASATFLSITDSGYFKPLKSKFTIEERLFGVSDWAYDICKKYKVDTVATEDIVSYMGGRSTARTIISLTSFNRTVALAGHRYLKTIKTSFPLTFPYSVITIRSTIKKEMSLKELPKEEVPDAIFKKFGNVYSMELNRNAKIKAENYDRADGIAVAWCHALKII